MSGILQEEYVTGAGYTPNQLKVAALNFANEIRADFGLKPIARLPKGHCSVGNAEPSCKTNGCVIANALVACCKQGQAVLVGGETARFFTKFVDKTDIYGDYTLQCEPEDEFKCYEVPSKVALFIDSFDNGDMPELTYA